MGFLKDECGNKYGKLTVLNRSFPNIGTTAVWYCRCDCGALLRVRGRALRTNNTRSCGCLQKEITRVGNFKHGHASRTGETREHRIWAGMLERCRQPSHAAFKRYGGAGITVCERWKEFRLFFQDMGKCPPAYSLERIDGTKGYAPDNCKWASIIEQGNNKRNNVRVAFKGSSVTVAQLSRLVRIPYLHLYNRIKRGMSAEVAIARARRKDSALATFRLQ